MSCARSNSCPVYNCKSTGFVVLSPITVLTIPVPTGKFVCLIGFGPGIAASSKTTGLILGMQATVCILPKYGLKTMGSQELMLINSTTRKYTYTILRTFSTTQIFLPFFKTEINRKHSTPGKRMILSRYLLVMNFTVFSRDLKVDHKNTVRDEEEKLTTRIAWRSVVLS